MIRKILTLALIAMFAISCGGSSSSDSETSSDEEMMNDSEEMTMEDEMVDDYETSSDDGSSSSGEDLESMEGADASGVITEVGDPEIMSNDDAEFYTNDDGMIIHNVLDINPTYMGGEEEMDKWLAENMKYPSAARRDNVEGTVIVSFIVDKDGNIISPQIEGGPENVALRDEAIRAISEMPRWQAGMKNGQPVNARYKLPITFKLQ
ncbi:energy transducer TonB [Marinigracilibium pacificum]|uniref:Energy transducer TonB n=1 Tax=Marinigracilibium pacificum TaxID=2729599 RepID=A0A848IZ27_9BACT|nr:energy transducer TonB [Marinigracilibium pacificum]NMM48535.1 energy transducer TonB [Marinigracilibium pacificum]